MSYYPISFSKQVQIAKLLVLLCYGDSLWVYRESKNSNSNEEVLINQIPADQVLILDEIDSHSE
jgi:hypothetical protein